MKDKPTNHSSHSKNLPKDRYLDSRRPSLTRSPSMPVIAQFKDIKIIAPRQPLQRLLSLPKVPTLKDLNPTFKPIDSSKLALDNGGVQSEQSPSAASSPMSRLTLSPFSDSGGETEATSPGLSILCDPENERSRQPSLVDWDGSETDVSSGISRRGSQETAIENSIRVVHSQTFEHEEAALASISQVEPPFHHVLPDLDPFEDQQAEPQVDTLILAKEKASFRKRAADYLDRHFYLTTSSPEIVLPYPPTDLEKTSYLNTKRTVVVFIGAFSFCATMAGFWLFSLAAAYFYWFAAAATFLQGHVILSYILGIFSRDFDHEGHLQILRENPITEESAPTVDILLPVCREPMEVIENTWKYVSRLRYPSHKLKIHVLDDGASEEVKEMASRFGFNYIVRDDRPRLCKAGNLRWAFKRTDGQFFVIFDADFVPRDDYLLEVVPRLVANPKVALVQTPQFFRTEIRHSYVERGAGEVQELFYRWGQVNRNKWNASICVGSNATYRREALQEVGGTAEVGASEDVHTGFGCCSRGWTLDYIPICLACGICPDSPRPFFLQQVRWCQGSTSLLVSSQFWKAGVRTKVEMWIRPRGERHGFFDGLALSIAQRACYLSGMLYYWSTAMNVFLIPLPGILLMWFRPSYLKYYNLAFAVPSILSGLLFWRLWAATNHSIAVQHVRVIQSYAYLSGLKDRLIGASMTWIASGSKTEKNARYRNARLLAIGWTLVVESFFVTGCVFRMLPIGGSVAWYNFFPLILLNAFNLYITLPFLLSP